MDPDHWFDWSRLHNPIYAHEGWSVKDACMVHSDNAVYLFFSAFFWDRGRERSHVVGVRTTDFRTYSNPLFQIDGREADWYGLCSPDLTKVDDVFVLTYNSWGDHPDKPNQLFYATSQDLTEWTFGQPLAPELTHGVRAIDAAVTQHHGRIFLSWKERQTPQIAWASNLEGPWHRLGRPGKGWFENQQFLTLDDTPHMLITRKDFQPYLMELEGNLEEETAWLRWSAARRLEVPQQAFNTHDRTNAAYLADWRHHDGYAYLLYAGSTEGHTHAGRGDNRLGLARSRDLQVWDVPPCQSSF